MTVVFVSNYINHHQIPFCDACLEVLGEAFRFIQTEPMEKERVEMGWGIDVTDMSYLHCLYEEEELCRKMIMECDVAIIGWTLRVDIIHERLSTGKMTIRISERLYREGQWKAVSPRGLISKYKEHTQYRNKQVYLLCAGAYVASDFHLVGAYPDKMFRFGYFPRTRRYREGELEGKKCAGKEVQLVWAGRFIPLKHPEFVLRLARELAFENRSFHMHIVGNGQMEQELKQLAQETGVSDYITFYGFREPDEVREIMEKSDIHLFTSNYLEGWGAVINEAMNSGCAVVANVEAGAVPFLIQHEKNGLIYRDGLYDDFAKQVNRLLDDPCFMKKLGKEAYKTIVELWNAEHAAQELLRFCKDSREGTIRPPKEGPFSVAPAVAPGKMYKRVVEGSL